MGVGVARGLLRIRLWPAGFSAFAVIRGRGDGVGLGSGVQVGSGLGTTTVVVSGVSPIVGVGVGVSAFAGVLRPPTRATPNRRPTSDPRMKRVCSGLEITRSAAVADQASAGCSAPNERIRASTSSMTESGVDAPAVIPIRRTSSNQSLRRSDGRST